MIRDQNNSGNPSAANLTAEGSWCESALSLKHPFLISTATLVLFYPAATGFHRGGWVFFFLFHGAVVWSSEWSEVPVSLRPEEQLSVCI